MTEPPPLLYCGELAGAWKPPWLLDELLPELLEEPPVDPVDPVELDPEELDPLDVEPLPVPFTAA